LLLFIVTQDVVIETSEAAVYVDAGRVTGTNAVLSTFVHIYRMINNEHE